MTERDHSAGTVAAVQPLWFADPERPLLGWLHRPAGLARGGVVICPPVGVELSHSHYTLRCLARELAGAGFAVLRFDYDGTGQSAGDLADPDRVEAWRDSIREAATVLTEWGVPWLAGVGLRLGATLLADVAAADGRFDAVALWDPCASGRTFLREQAALHLVASPPTELTEALGPLPGQEITGYHVGEALAAELRALSLPDGAAFAGRRVLMLTDPARIGVAKLTARLPEADVQPYASREAVFDLGEHRFTRPTTLIAQLREWIAGACDSAAAVAAAVATSAVPGRDEAVVGHAPDGAEILERVVRVGRHGLTAIECAPRGGSQGPTLLMLSLAAESSIGPVRQWVALSRAWAAAGVRSVRLDLSGVGESSARPDLPERTVYAHEHVEEILDAAAAVSPDDPRDVVLIGVCSGAIHALAAGPRLGPRGVVAINPILTFVMPDRPGAAPTSGPSAIPRPPGQEPPPSPAQQLKRALGARIPRPLWSALYAVGVASSPAARLRPLAKAGVDTLLMLGSNESRVPLARTPGALTQLHASGNSRVVIAPGLDHSLRNEASRRLVAATITDFLSDVFGRPLHHQPVAAVPAGHESPVDAHALL